jgi:hypothetical protein
VHRDVTALHYGSVYWDVDRARALLDHSGDVETTDMLSVCDNCGRLPLHWAAAGAERLDEELLPKDSVPSSCY